MLEAFTIGPFLVPTRPLAVIVSLMLAMWSAQHLARRSGLDARWAGRVAEHAGWIGLLGARCGYVAINWSAFAAQPWSALYLWQPGYLAVTGIASGAAYALWRLWRRAPAQRLPYFKVLGAAYSGGAIVLAGMVLALYSFAPADVLRRGDRVTDFVLLDLAGNSVRFSSLDGRGVVINFWATWCAPCRREMPLLDAIHTEYGHRGLTVLGINLDEPADTVVPFIAATKVRYPIWLDANPARPELDRTRAIYQRFGGVGLPTSVFVDRQGIVRDTHIGELNRAIVQERAEEILSP